LVEVTREVDAGLQELEDSSVSFWGAYIDKLGDHVGHQSVMDLMSETVVSASPDDALYVAASRMLRERVHRLPVVDSNEHLVGIVSMTDIMTAFVACSPAAKE
jgi:CBS domain-containing protein